MSDAERKTFERDLITLEDYIDDKTASTRALIIIARILLGIWRDL